MNYFTLQYVFSHVSCVFRCTIRTFRSIYGLRCDLHLLCVIPLIVEFFLRMESRLLDVEFVCVCVCSIRQSHIFTRQRSTFGVGIQGPVMGRGKPLIYIPRVKEKFHKRRLKLPNQSYSAIDTWFLSRGRKQHMVSQVTTVERNM